MAVATRVALAPEELRTTSLSMSETPCSPRSLEAIALLNWIVIELRPPVAVTRNALPITIWGAVPAASAAAAGPCSPSRRASDLATSTSKRPVTRSLTE